jgi:chromosome segregation ATPase
MEPGLVESDFTGVSVTTVSTGNAVYASPDLASWNATDITAACTQLGEYRSVLSRALEACRGWGQQAVSDNAAEAEAAEAAEAALAALQQRLQDMEQAAVQVRADEERVMKELNEAQEAQGAQERLRAMELALAKEFNRKTVAAVAKVEAETREQIAALKTDAEGARARREQQAQMSAAQLGEEVAAVEARIAELQQRGAAQEAERSAQEAVRARAERELEELRAQTAQARGTMEAAEARSAEVESQAQGAGLPPRGSGGPAAAFADDPVARLVSRSVDQSAGQLCGCGCMVCA